MRHALVILLLVMSAKQASAITATRPLERDHHRIVIYKTTEDSVYYTVPSEFYYYKGGFGEISMEHLPNGVHRLRVLIEANTKIRARLEEDVRERDPYAIFMPLPLSITDVDVYIPETLGQTTRKHIFSKTVGGVGIYLRIDIQDDQLEAWRQLAEGGIFLTGTVSYSYKTLDGWLDTEAPITVLILNEDLFKHSNT